MTTLDLTGPLPNGTLVLEASAGTGKTYALCCLAVRYLAEGIVLLPEMLLITFSRTATAELRSRVRDSLTRAIRGLTAFLDSGALPADPVEAHLCTGATQDVESRLSRLQTAAADFDAATIATTHEFCQRMLFGLGVLADHDPAPEFVADPRTITREVTADLFLQRFANTAAPFPYSSTWKDRVPAQKFVQKAVAEPAATIVPEGAARAAGERADFARQAREEVEQRKLRQRLFTYDDQLVRLRDALVDDVTGALARARLSERFTVVLVDEFQDTDPIQWQILFHTFHHRSTLVLIGDPKQAIYGFRGADVGTYQAAVQVADDTAALTINYRSDAALVSAIDQLFGGAQVGTEIVVPSVTAAAPDRRIASSDSTFTRPFRIRGTSPRNGPLATKEATSAIISDLVAEASELLTSDVTIATGGAPRPLRPGDIAVLVRTNAMGKRIGTALRAAGIAAAVSGSDSLFGTDAATEWLQLLHALMDRRSGLIREAALTSFLGYSLHDLATASDTELSELGETIHAWSQVWHTYGAAALWQAIVARPDFAVRVKARPDGDRMLADLRQVGQELELAESRGMSGVVVVDWLQSQIADRPDTRRNLARDDEAIHVLTIHKAKGLEFPVVLLPDQARRTGLPRPDDTLVFHDQQGRRCVDVGGRQAPGREARVTAARVEADAESLREFYVAATRAQVGVVVWWLPEKSTPYSPLHRLLARPAGITLPGMRYELDDIQVRSDRPDLSFEVVDVAQPRTPRPVPRENGSENLQIRAFARHIDTTWRRTSYSGLTAAAHELAFSLGPIAREADEPGEATSTDDRPLTDQLPTASDTSTSSPVVSPFAGLPRGADFGTLVHSAFEELDFAAPDLDAELIDVCTRLTSRSAVALTARQLASALKPVLLTPLGPLSGGRRLADFAHNDRLDELSFDLPLNSRHSATMSTLADLWEAHLPATDPLFPYSDMLRSLSATTPALSGVLTGSIDAVLRLQTENRFLVIDYKTNQLGDDKQLISAYEPKPLAAAMMDNHYPLQALFYCVALHRYLRWRLRGYRPDTHLGGVGYLFVRGMAGSVGPEPSPGVFAWNPPADLVTAVSDALAGVPSSIATREGTPHE